MQRYCPAFTPYVFSPFLSLSLHICNFSLKKHTLSKRKCREKDKRNLFFDNISLLSTPPPWNRKSHQEKFCLHFLAVSVARLATLSILHFSSFRLTSSASPPFNLLSFCTPSPLNALEIQNLLIRLSSENPIRSSSLTVVDEDERERENGSDVSVSSRRLKLAFSSGWIIPHAHWLACKPASLISPL